ncbi:hypothetical protein M3E18_00635 [Kocuria sp. p3-SID1433]|uniref:hypothetical protein n=1 Tax=unclassified Kocuria TaxID=2649579 RepID=UPI0021A7D905|nr:MULTISPECIES: hypothetical protein [unclassified Kocuria]MCT1600962.1 hypothetical protein [Kocuria sp. p3-SID1428]MCT2179066.1 hypothetical protein [Kocuria sp. p3-SID1433]
MGTWGAVISGLLVAAAGLMTLLELGAGQLDVDRVSSIISGITPLVVIAVLAAFLRTMSDLPQDLSQLCTVAQQAESPVRPRSRWSWST